MASTKRKNIFRKNLPSATLRTSFLTALAIVLLVAGCAAAAPLPDVGTAFWSRNWKMLDTLAGNEERSPDKRDKELSLPPSLTPREKSLYLNALWTQGRYEEGLLVLDIVSDDLPPELLPYSSMLRVLGMERTDRKREAHEAGAELWDNAPLSVRYYLAYAMGRLSETLEHGEETMIWYRRMLELAPDRKRRMPALLKMIDLPGVTADEATALLIDAPSNQKALAVCRKIFDEPSGTNTKVEYALGYNAYITKKYAEAMKHLELASADKSYGEAAQYYHGYAAYREKKDEAAYKSWSRIALSGFDYPQRSVARLITLASRSKRQAVIKLLGEVAERREKDYPELAADALVGLIRLGGERTAGEAEKKLFASHSATAQAATIRWERGWRAWKAGDTKTAYGQWSEGYSEEIPNRELASRLLYWQTKALQKLGSPVAAERVKQELVRNYPAEYHTFLASPDGGIRQAAVPKSYDRASTLEEWGFVTYARIEAAAESLVKPDVQSLYRSIRLSHWEGDYSSGVRAFSILQRHIPAPELASSELLKNWYPPAFEPEVRAAARRTGLDAAIVWGIMRQESLYEPDVTSSAGAYGLMQLMPATGRSEARKMKLDEEAYKQPATNILLGANHMVGLLARFKDIPRSLAAYNAGGTPVTRWSKGGVPDMEAWIEDIGYRETRGYVKAVLRNINVYKQIYREAASK